MTIWMRFSEFDCRTAASPALASDRLVTAVPVIVVQTRNSSAV